MMTNFGKVFFYFLILLCVFPYSAAAGGKPNKDNAELIRQFGDLKYIDNITTTIAKLKAMGCDKITLDIQATYTKKIDFSDITDASSAESILIDAIKDRQKIYNLFFDLGTVVITAESVAVNGLPFMITVIMTNQPGYAVEVPDRAINVYNDQDLVGIIAYSISEIWVCDLTQNQNKLDIHKNITKLLDKKYARLRTSDAELEKVIKSRYRTKDKKKIEDIRDSMPKVYTDKIGSQIFTTMDDYFHSHSNGNSSHACFAYSFKDSFDEFYVQSYKRYRTDAEKIKIGESLKGKKDMSNGI